jgi:hypothetical protein
VGNATLSITDMLCGRRWTQMNPSTPESLCNTDQFSK